MPRYIGNPREIQSPFKYIQKSFYFSEETLQYIGSIML